MQIRQFWNTQHICNPVQIKCIWKMILHVFAKELQLKIYFCTQLQNDCIFEWFKLKMLLIKIVVLMVKNQTTLSSFQFYFFEMNNEKRWSFPLQFPTFNFPPPPWFEPPSSRSLSLSPPRLGPLLYQDILRERAKFDNRNNFYLCFFAYFCKRIAIENIFLYSITK